MVVEKYFYNQISTKEYGRTGARTSDPFIAVRHAPDCARRLAILGNMSHVRYKSVCSQSEASLEILDITFIYIILSRKRTIKALIRLRGCAG